MRVKKLTKIPFSFCFLGMELSTEKNWGCFGGYIYDISQRRKKFQKNKRLMKDSIHKNPSVKQSSREILPPRVFHMRMRNAAY